MNMSYDDSKRGAPVQHGEEQSSSTRQTRAQRKTPEGGIWDSMRSRCKNPNATNYHRYGGRGISVCARWDASFEAFLADMGPRPSELHSLDRIDNDGNYEPGNCRWATQDVQCANRVNGTQVTWGGETMNITQWAKRMGLSKGTLALRLKQWPLEEAMTKPLKNLSQSWRLALVNRGRR